MISEGSEYKKKMSMILLKNGSYLFGGQRDRGKLNKIDGNFLVCTIGNIMKEELVVTRG